MSNEFIPIRTKTDVGWLFAPDPTEGAYSAPRNLAGFKGAALQQNADGREEGLTGGSSRWEGKIRQRAEGMGGAGIGGRRENRALVLGGYRRPWSHHTVA